MDLDRLRHVVIEGPIGVGKTSLAKRLAERLHADALLEQPDANPFLAKFYRDPPRYALQTQLFFLFQRLEQWHGIAQTDLFARPVVGDFLIDKDPLFARLTLSDDEFGLYLRIHDALRTPGPAPDLVVYLQARPETLVERVQRRGVRFEAGISEDYLRRLSSSYTDFFHAYDGAPVLMVNTERLNPVDLDEDFILLVERIERMRGRREFFNRAD